MGFIHAERSTKRRRLNNNDDGDITARINALGSSIETLQNTVSIITDDQTYNGGGNNHSGGNNNSGKNAQNGNGNGNNRSNSGNFGKSTRRHGAFSYMTTAMTETTKVHDMNHVLNPTKPDNIPRTELDSHADTTCAGKNMTLL